MNRIGLRTIAEPGPEGARYGAGHYDERPAPNLLDWHNTHRFKG